MSAWTCRCQSAGKAAPKIVPLLPRTPCWKGLGADSEEKREPVSDINTAVVDSLKVLDPKRPIREAVIEKCPARPSASLLDKRRDLRHRPIFWRGESVIWLRSHIYSPDQGRRT